MTSNKYREIKNTVTRINNKLLDFISGKKEVEGIIKDLSFQSGNPKVDLNKPPLDTWISSDYRSSNGNTFIEEFLELNSHTLKPLEVEILKQKLISHISMFEILSIDDTMIHIEDKFDSKFYSVIDDNIGSVLLEGDLVLARIAKIRGHYIFIGDVEYLPSSIKDVFTEHLFIQFNRERKTQPNLEIKNFLKRYSLDIYSIYRECLVYHMEDTEEDIPAIISDITEFQDYALESFPGNYHIHMTNLMEIFEYGLMEKNLSLQDINKINLTDFFKSAIKDGFIKSKEDYNSYLETIKIYLEFLGPGNPEYKNSYNHIIEISNNRFKYMSKLKNTNFNYDYDRMLVSTLSDKLNSNSMTLVGDLDRFLIYVMEFEIELTPKRKEIRKSELISLNKLFKLSDSFNDSRPKQSDSKLIQLFYHLSLKNGLVTIEDTKMIITSKGKNFFKLKDEEKYTIILSYIWSGKFIKEVSLPRKLQMKIDDLVVDKFLKLEYDNLDDLISEIPDIEVRKSLLLTGFAGYLMLLGIVAFNKDSVLAFTSLGKLVYKYMLSIKGKQRKVINMENYKEKRTKEV